VGAPPSWRHSPGASDACSARGDVCRAIIHGEASSAGFQPAIFSWLACVLSCAAVVIKKAESLKILIFLTGLLLIILTDLMPDFSQIAVPVVFIISMYAIWLVDKKYYKR
jgi:hypothetical protein